jgi:hypothetical protein
MVCLNKALSVIRFFEDLGCITAPNVGYLAQNVDFIVSRNLLLVFRISLLHNLSRNIRDYRETKYVLFGTDSRPARNKGFIDGDDDDDKTMTTSKTMLGKYGLVIIMRA